MDKSAVLGVISRFKRALESRSISVDRIVLFGSYAAGTQQDGSDIDLIVVSKDFANKGYWERIDVLSDAIYEVFQPIEAVAMTPEEWESGSSLIAEYARTGEVIE